MKIDVRTWLHSFLTQQQSRRRLRRTFESEVFEARRLLAGEFQLLRDIQTDLLDDPAGNKMVVGDTMFVVLSTPTLGTELWKTSVAGGSASLVKDISARASTPRNLTSFNGNLYFSVTNSETLQEELWKSDGTEAGTTRVREMPAVSGTLLQTFRVAGSRLFFSFTGSASGHHELWVSDGTASGTIPLRRFETVASFLTPSSLTNIGGTLFFAANGSGQGMELWKSDGTVAGTVQVKDINPGSAGSIPRSFTNLNGTLYFYANDGATGVELWKSDGTADGTLLVKDIAPGTISSTGSEISPSLAVVGNRLFMSRINDGIHGPELWVSDGTPAGTQLLRDIRPGAEGSSTGFVVNMAGVGYFGASDGTDGAELWRTDGTTAGTTAVSSLPGNDAASIVTDLNIVNGTVFFGYIHPSAGTLPEFELWKSDGTAAGTTLVRQFGAGTDIYATTTYKGHLFFALRGSATPQSWMTDGTASGTRKTRLLGNRTGDALSEGSPAGARVNGRFYFSDGSGLWMTDGTREGTSRVPGAEGLLPESMENVGGRLIFSAASGSGTELWTTDGTATGTKLVKDIFSGTNSSTPSEFTVVNDTLFFIANDAIRGQELWKTDGTPEGTVLVKDIRPGADDSAPAMLTNANGVLYFRAADGSHGTELWVSDGTESGTVQVADLQPGPAGSDPASLVFARGNFWFTANDGTSGRELWRTDGTAAGTTMVRDINPGALPSNPAGLTEVTGGKLVLSAVDASAGRTLWVTDGTPEGTVMIKDFLPSSSSSASTITFLGALNDRAIFAATAETSGSELWASDGTTAGTTLLRDILPGSRSSLPGPSHRVADVLYFSADDGVNGRELWKTDGTTAGTQLAADFAKGSGSSRPVVFELSPDRILAAATTDAFGREFFVCGEDTPITAAPAVSVVTQRPSFHWSPVSGAASYDLWVRNSSRGILNYIRTSVTGTEYTPDFDMGIGQFTLWVRSSDTAGRKSEWSTGRTFSITSPVIVNAPDYRQETARPKITWQTLKGAVRYDIWINDLSRSVAQVVRESSVTADMLAVSVDLPVGLYRVWVRGIDAGGQARSWSVPHDFLVAPAPLAVAPLNSTFERRPEFAWQPVAGADQYELLVIDRNTAAIAINQVTSSVTLRPNSDLAVGSYRWQVRARNDSGYLTSYSPQRQIWIGGRPTVLTPIGSSGTLPRITWTPVTGAVKYRLHVDRLDVATLRVIYEANLLATEYQLTAPLPRGRWRVWVQAVASTGELSAWSIPQEFASAS